MKFYAVAKGVVPGIYTDWATTQSMIKAVSGAIYKSFPTKELAEDFMKKATVQEKITEGSITNVCYTDGSYADEKCGFGVVVLRSSSLSSDLRNSDLRSSGILQKDKHVAYGQVPESVGCTNNVGELYAIYVALSLVKEDVIIYSDSRYSISCLTAYADTWTGKERTNQNLISAILHLMKGRIVKLEYVKAHCGIELNEEADMLANKGRLCQEELIIESV